MARILVATPPGDGHINPMVAVVRELVRRGREVRWYTGQHYRPKVEAAGAAWRPMRAGYDFGGKNRAEAFPHLGEQQGLGGFKAGWKAIFMDTAPGVHVTQGTVSNEAHRLLLPAIRALASEDVLVVATTGGPPVESLGLSTLPANVRIERFIPHAHLLPHVSVMVTNGGYSGVQAALSHGVPLIVAGNTEEKPEVAAHVAWAGVGLDLKTGQPSEARIRQAVRMVLGDPRYRQRARQLQEEYRTRNGPQRAAELIEGLVRTRRPVPRAA